MKIFTSIYMVVVAGVGMLVGSCFSPDYGDGGFHCDINGACPDGYRCHEENNGHICRSIEALQSAFTMTIEGDTDTVSPGGKINFSVGLSTTNFTYRDPATTDGTPKDGEGHYHIYVDKITPKYLTKGFASTVSVTLPETIARGPHKLIFLLVKSNHSPYFTGSTGDATWPFTVQ